MAEKDAHQGDSNFPLIRDGVASYLHDNDPEETREWMDSLDGLLDHSDPERAREMGRAGRKRAEEHFAWEAIAERTLEVYRTVIEQSR